MSLGGASTIDDPALAVTDAMIAVDDAISHLPAKSAIQLLEFCRRRIDASEARVLANRIENGATNRNVEDLLRSENNTSKAEAKRRTKRAKATNANPDIANRLENGTLSSEQADIIAEAAEDTDGAAACDTQLIEDIASTSPEQGKKKAKTYVNNRRSKDDVQKVHDGQRRRRTVYRHRTSNGDHAITFQGDEASIDQVEASVDAGAEIEYRTDGGRDVPRAEHPRTHDQRRFDAAVKHFTKSAETSESTEPKPSSPKPSSRKTTMFISVTTSQLSGADDSVITTCDGKPLPQSVIDEIACGADFIAQVFSADGELLWQGREVRLATPAQINGLISRDGGCVLCQAHHSRCVAHHCDPFGAPMQGETNIDRLALLCEDCHSRVHQRKQTLYFERESKTWKLRNARWEEIPPEGSKHRASQSDRTRSKPTGQKPRLDEARRNRMRQDPHGDRLSERLF